MTDWIRKPPNNRGYSEASFRQNFGAAILFSVLVMFIVDFTLIAFLLPGGQDVQLIGILLAAELGLAALVFCLLLPIEMLFAALFGGLLRLTKRPALSLLLLCSPLAVLGFPLGKQLFSGPAARTMALAEYAPYLAAVLLPIGFWILLVISRWLLARSRPVVLGTGLLAFIAALLLLISDRMILPGLYHPMHWLQQALALLALQIALLALLPQTLPRLLRSSFVLWAIALPVALLILIPTTRRPVSPALSRFVSWGSVSRYSTEQLLSLWPDKTASDFFNYLAELPAEDSIPVPYVPTPEAKLKEFKSTLPTVPLNFMLVIVDALRADQIAAFNLRKHEPSLTPHLDEFARRSFRFRNTTSQASNTAFSIPSLFSSQVVLTGNEMRFPTYIDQFDQIGYHTFGALPQYFHLINLKHVTFINEGFGRVEYTEKKTRVDFEASTKELLEQETKDPFFAYIHFYQLHEEYYYPPGYTNDYPGFEKLSDYDKATLYTDEVFGRMIEQMTQQGLLENTIIAVTADHGEAFMEHGRKGHSTSCYWEQVRVPMMLYIPGMSGGETDAHVGNLDLLPTAAELFDLPDRTHFLGRSLIPLMMGEEDQADRVYFTRSDGKKARAVLDGRYKLIYSAKTLQLFDLQSDPNEMRDIFYPESPVAKRLMLELYQVYPWAWKQMLGELDETSFSQCLALLKHAPSVRARRVAAGLVRLHPSALRKKHMKELVALFKAESSSEVRIALAKLLNKYSGKQGRDALLQRFTQSHGRERYETAYALYRQKSTRHDSLFLKMLNDSKEDPALRQLAAKAIVKKSSEKALATYLDLIKPGQPNALRVAAIKALHGIGGKSIAQPLQQLLNDPDYKIRYTAAESLGFYSSSATILLQHYKTETHPLVKRGLLVALARTRAPEAFELCKEALNDRMMIVPAIYGFAKLNDKRALPLLKKVASTYDNRWTRGLANQTVKRLKRLGK